MRILTAAGMAALALGLVAGGASDTHAQGKDANIGGWSGGGASSNPSCPNIAWSVHRAGSTSGGGAIAGVVWFTDMSGISSGRGSYAADGKFTVTLTSVSGVGPTGTVTGVQDANGGVTADLNGPGCSHLHLRARPAEMIPAGSG